MAAETFPRGTKAMPRLATPPRFPGALQSWGQSGKGQVRSVQNMGREWEEIYPLLDTSLQSVRALLTALNRGLRDGVLWEVQHPYWHERNGVGGGSPVVGSQFRKVWQFDDSGASFVDETTDANDAGAGDWSFFPAGSGNNDYVALGFPVPFGRVSINVSTAGVGTYTVTWEYWNGSAWAALDDVTDSTNGFKTTGTNNVSFTVPSDWAASSLNSSDDLYYIRARRNGGTVTTNPVGTQGFVRLKQFGSNLVIDDASASTTNWLRAGDLIAVAGGAVVYDVTGDVTTTSQGWATVPISPPIFTGGEPADGAIVTIDPDDIKFQAYIVSVSAFPSLDVTKYIDAGLTVVFREQPQ